MKKFLIAICGILVVGNAFGLIDDYFAEPATKSSYASNWGADEGGYSISAPNFKIAGDYKSKKGTFGDNDEGAIVATIARNIYENGAYLCTTQIQAAHRNGRRYIWLDYYEPLNGSHCAPMCKKGFYGATCNLTTSQDCDQTNYKSKFKATLKTNGGYDVTNYTKDMVVFDYQNQRANNSKQATHVVLGVVEYKEHGVVVAPIKVIGERDGVATWGQKSWIESANSNGNTTLLCAEGYVPNNNNTDCNEASWCENKKQLNKLCPGYSSSEYDEDVHELQKGTDSNGKSCYNIRCFAGYGFKSENDKATCIPCEGGPLAYVNNDGFCDVCIKGEYPNGTTCKKGNMDTYSQTQMKSGPNGGRDCWLETDPEKFGGCVICNTNNQCWNGKSCTTCD